MKEKYQLENMKTILEMSKIGCGLSSIVSFANGIEFGFKVLDGDFSLKSLLYMIVFFYGSYQIIQYEKILSKNIEEQERLLQNKDELTRERTL